LYASITAAPSPRPKSASTRFTLALDVSGFSLPDADGSPWLSFNRLHVGLRLASLWRLAPELWRIILQQPTCVP